MSSYRQIITEAIQNAIDNTGSFNWDRTPRDIVAEMVEYGVTDLKDITKAERIMTEIIREHAAVILNTPQGGERLRISTADMKYTVIQRKDGSTTALRYAGDWPAFDPERIAANFQLITELRSVVGEDNIYEDQERLNRLLIHFDTGVNALRQRLSPGVGNLALALAYDLAEARARITELEKRIEVYENMPLAT